MQRMLHRATENDVGSECAFFACLFSLLLGIHLVLPDGTKHNSPSCQPAQRVIYCVCVCSYSWQVLHCFVQYNDQSIYYTASECVQ